MNASRAAWLVLFGVLLTSTRGRAMTGDRQGRMTLAQVRELARSVGFPNPELAAAIAYAESNGFPRILGDEGTSFGLWQVNRPSHPDLASADLLDPLVNARAALAISRGGTDFTPWTQYRTGAYQKYLALQGTA